MSKLKFKLTMGGIEFPAIPGDFELEPMSIDTAKNIALQLSMQRLGRYLECLNGVVNTYEKVLPKEFIEEVRKDFADYASKMEKYGYPFKDLKHLAEE